VKEHAAEVRQIEEKETARRARKLRKDEGAEQGELSLGGGDDEDEDHHRT
jgi:hypothetical protein